MPAPLSDSFPYISMSISPQTVVRAGYPPHSLARSPTRFVEGITKLAGNTLGDHRKKTGKLTTRIPKVVGLTGTRRLNHPYQESGYFRRLTRLGSAGILPRIDG
ncbi:hypothetical protein BHE74_00058465 [Ensete ventricosum]|nr:hypothetical protein BHE74_00058465 [Ensete ventricosum]